MVGAAVAAAVWMVVRTAAYDNNRLWCTKHMSNRAAAAGHEPDHSRSSLQPCLSDQLAFSAGQLGTGARLCSFSTLCAAAAAYREKPRDKRFVPVLSRHGRRSG